MGFFDIFKKSRKQINRDNQAQGRAGEKKSKMNMNFQDTKYPELEKDMILKQKKRIGLETKLQNTLKLKLEIPNYLNFKRKNEGI